MKRYFMACLCAVAALVACDPDSGITKVNVIVTVDDSELQSGINPDSYNVTLTNTNGGTAVKAETENGVATAALIPGIYNIVVDTQYSDGTVNYIFAGAETNVAILENDTEITVKVRVTKESQLVIKETYYTGCTYKTGEVAEDGTESEDTWFRDQFHEIYNNSDEVAYADGLCIAYTIFADYKYEIFYTYDITDAGNYVYAQQIWQIGGDGDDYPIQPGESIIIAQWATNHKAEILTNGGSPVDLSGAEFEAIEGAQELWNASITDGPANNMSLVVSAQGTTPMQWLVPTGGANLIIFKPSTAFRTANFLSATNDENSFMSLAQEVAISDILDAVQSIDDETRIQTLGMPVALDKGYIWCSGTYVGESIARKPAGTLANGKPKYLDTNNTTNDFEVQKTPMIRRNNAGVPSWNTWNN